MMDIKLYQINQNRDEERRALLSTEALARRGFDPKVIDSSIYDCVFEGTVNCRRSGGGLHPVQRGSPGGLPRSFHVCVRRGGGRQNGLLL